MAVARPRRRQNHNRPDALLAAMSRRALVALYAALGLAAALVPVAASLYLSWANALETERAALQRFAREAIVRTDRVVVEGRAVLARLAQSTAARCSPEHIRLMRNAAFGARYIREVRHVAGGQVRCTAGGPLELPVPGGAPDFVSPRGYRIWFAVAGGATPDERFLAAEYGDHSLLIDPAHLVDVLTGDPDRRLAVLAVEGLRPLALLNDPPLAAVRAVYAGTGPAPLLHSAAHSDELPIVAIAVESRDQLAAAWRRQAAVVLPLGLAGGLALALGVRSLARRRFSLAGDLRAAVAGREFIVHYQPLVALADGRCVGAEALVRWRRWDGEMVPPELFIPAAEQEGLIQPITDQVIGRVVADLGPLLARSPDLHVAVNIAACDLLTERVADVIARSVAGTGVKPAQIALEATERGFIDANSARVVIERLRIIGHAVAIDDFGTGYSSLSYLQSFRVDALKIDKAFVDAIGAGAATSGVIDHIIAMAKELGLAIVAEGVETAVQADYLRARGVDIGQGYHFSRPLPPEAFAAFADGGAKPA
jgi:sensor c-di-GMP phosphodiesterase-like protein